MKRSQEAEAWLKDHWWRENLGDAGKRGRSLGSKTKKGRFLLMPQEWRMTGREEKKLSKKEDSDSKPFPKLTQFEIFIFSLKKDHKVLVQVAKNVKV